MTGLEPVEGHGGEDAGGGCGGLVELVRPPSGELIDEVAIVVFRQGPTSSFLRDDRLLDDAGSKRHYRLGGGRSLAPLGGKMGSKQEFFRLVAEALRLQSALKTAADLDETFKKRVWEMLDGTGKLVTPDEAKAFTKMINDAKNRQPEQAKKLADVIYKLVVMLEKQFADNE